jgi:hypothetical protein
LGDPTEVFKKEYGDKIQVVNEYSFGNPPRVGRIDANAKGLFGALNDSNPSAKQFFKGIKKIIPSDYILIASYQKNGAYLTETYAFKSLYLKQIPGIKSAMTYQDIMGFKGHPVGTFKMIINRDIKDRNLIENFIVALGMPEEVGLKNMKKVSKNPFR